MQTIEIRHLGKTDEKGPVYNRTIVGKTGETKPTGWYEDMALREGDVFVEYGNSGATVFMYNETDGAWYEM